jgi:hypothetical protein
MDGFQGAQHMADTKDTKPDAGAAVPPDNARQEESVPKWQTLGFESEDAALEAAANAAKFADERDKAKAARDKLALDFQRQSTELGELRKRAKQNTEQPAAAADGTSDDDVLDSVQPAEAEALDRFIDASPDLKAKIVKGGKPAMAQTVRLYRQNQPLDLKSPVFSRPRPAGQQSINEQSIEKLVKAAFERVNKQEAAGLPATSQTSAVPDGGGARASNLQVGPVTVDFFKRKAQ